MAKDKLQPLYRLLGEGNVSKAVEMGEELVKELEEELSSKRKQIALVREILGPYRNSMSKDGLTPTERGQRIRQAALVLVTRGAQLVTTQEVLDYLREEEGIEFAVRRPASVVGTVVAKMGEFKRADMGRFRFVGAALPQREEVNE